MAILKKSSFSENLDAYSVLVKDTDPSSRYFRITDLPDTFTGGKNSFLIQGSSELVSDTVVKVEIKDSKGNIIYTEPGEGIPEYYEGVSKPVAVYVYPDTAFGPCTITILGELDRYEVDGRIEQVPTEWKGKYNIRWQKTVQVNPVLTNSSKIRFYRRPKVAITESVLPIFNRSVTRKTISGSVQGIGVIPAPNTNLRSYRGDTLYELYATSSIFSSSMEGETITLTGLPREHITTIRDVVNGSKLSIEIPYYETSSVSPIAPQIVKNFMTASFTMSFNEAVNLTSSSLFSSFAKITLTDLEAFSGDPSRLKVFSKRKADIGNYTLLEDIKLESSEILIADSFSGSVDVRTGQFATQGIVDYFWTYQDPQSSTLYTPIVDNNLLANSVKLVDAGIDSTTDFPQRIFFYSHSISFTKDTEYELDFLPLLSSSAYLPAQLEVYVSGAAFADTDSNKRLGKRLGQFIHDTDFRRYDLQQFNFKPDSDGTGTVLFAVYQGNWQISNIGLRASQETNFSPNEVRLNITMPTVVKNDTYDFRFEFYDVNNNYVPVLVEKEYTFTGGTDLSNLGGASASIFAFKPDSTIFPFGYNNNYDFQEVNTFASIPNGAKEINFAIQKTNITGDVLIGSSAFDSGGLYIDPAVYATASQPYPGFLTNVTATDAVLTVENFTGSLANIEVKRIEYTASVSSYTDIVNIFKVVEGTPGSDGNNSVQYVIRPKTGTAIKNSDPATYLEVQIVKVDASNPSVSSVTDVSSGNVKLVTGSNTIVNAGNGVTAGTNGVNYNARFFADKISGSLVVGAYDFDQSILLDTITLADITDGITTGFVEASNGLILKRLTDNTYTPANTALTASFFDAQGTQYSQSILITANYSSGDQLKYENGIDDPNINLDYVRTVGGTPMSNNVYANTQGLTAKFTFTEPNTGQQISVTEGVAIATDGTKGANSITTIITPPTQTVRKNVSLSSYGTPITYFIQLLETGSALTYTTTNPPASNGEWTLQVASGNGTNNSVNGTKSGSITPPSVASDSGVTSSFAYRYRDSNGNLSDFISGSHYVGVVFDGQDGQNVGDAGQNAIEINIEPSTQTVTRNPANQFGTPRPFTIYVSETGSLMTYTTNDPPASIGEWTIAITTGEGTNGSTAGAKSGSITPPSPTTSTPLGTSSSFAIKYKNSKGTVSQYLSQSYFVGVSFDGVNGPGVVFTGVWQSGRVYQFDSGSSGRRDVVLWSRTGNEPYNSYFGALRAHTSDGTTGATGNGAPNYSTGSVGSAWLELGQESFFVAAKIGLFEESFVKNTINVGSTNNGGVAAANITIAGSGSYPYISIGQADSAGSQGYGLNGIFLGAVKDTTDSDKRKFRFSLVSGSNYLKWDGTGQLLISGTVSASEGRIGGVVIGGDKLYIGTGTYNNANTAFYVDSTGQFSLEDKLTWDPVNNYLNINGTVTAQTGSFGGIIIGSNKIYIGTGTYNNANTAFYVDSTGQFSLEDKLNWDPVNNYLNINGTITAQTGSFGGVIIGSNKIYIGTGTYNNRNTAFYVDNTGQFSLKDNLAWDGNTLFISGTVSASAGAIGGVYIDKSRLYLGDGIFTGSATPFFVSSSGRFSLGDTVSYEPLTRRLVVSGTISASAGAIGGVYIDNSRLYLGTGIFSSSATPFFISSSGRFSLGDTVIYEPTTRQLTVSGTLAADSITAREIQNINFGIDKGVDFRSGSIGGWTLQDGRILSNNTSMSIDSNNSSITIYSGSTDSAGVKQPTISIKPGGLTGLSATSSLMTINNLSTSTQNLSTNSPYTATTILLVSGSNSIMTIATDKQGTYVGAVSASAIAGTVLTLTSWKGSVQLNLNVQVSTSPTFDTLLETVNVGNATYITDYTTPVTTTVGFTNKSTAQPLTVAFPTAGTYYARATWYFKALFYGGGSVSVSTVTSTVSSPNRLQQQVSLSEISDGGMQVIYNSSRYVKIPRASSGTMLEVGGDITATGNITAYFSDERLKTILGIIDNPLQKINRLKGIYYIQNQLAKQLGYEDDRQQIGLIAQDVQEVLPETIDLAPIDNDGQGNSKTGENYLTIHYERVIPLLVEAIKELTRQVEELKQNK